jgi:hypothetical protein
VKDDEALRRAFARWRDDDGRYAPSFSSVLRKADRARTARWWRMGLACTALTLVAAVVLIELAAHPSRRARSEMSAHIMDFRTSTDFLLDTPGSELLRDVPRFGAVTPLTAPTPSAPEGSRSASASEKSS